MSPEQFRKLMLSIDGVEERAHGGHPDFRFSGKVVASLGAPAEGWAMLKLTPQQQQAAIAGDATSFQPCAGVWGERGYTNVKLSGITLKHLRGWVELAIENQSSAE